MLTLFPVPVFWWIHLFFRELHQLCLVEHFLFITKYIISLSVRKYSVWKSRIKLSSRIQCLFFETKSFKKNDFFKSKSYDRRNLFIYIKMLIEWKINHLKGLLSPIWLCHAYFVRLMQKSQRIIYIRKTLEQAQISLEPLYKTKLCNVHCSRGDQVA